MQDELYTVDEVVSLWRHPSRRTLYRLMASGQLPYHKIGDRRLLARSDLEELRASTRVRAAS
jgi:excisionase family DNA binding protein